MGTPADLARVRSALGPLPAGATGAMTGVAAPALAGKSVLLLVGTALLGGALWIGMQPRALTYEPEPHAPPAAVARPAAVAVAAPAVATEAIQALPPSAEAGASRARPAQPTAARPSREVRRRPASRNAAAPRTANALSATSLAGELDLLRRAQTLVDTRPAEALAVLDTHARSYPAGVFAQERESLAIDALRKLGRREQAHARAHAFVQRYPQSPHTRRIGTWLEPVDPVDSDHKNEASPLPTR